MHRKYYVDSKQEDTNTKRIHNNDSGCFISLTSKYHTILEIQHLQL
jgi:hypothetical protein